MEEDEDFYISNRDMEEALNAGKPRRKLTKEQQIYGIWADDTNDNFSQKRRKPLKNIQQTQKRYHKKNLSKPQDTFGSWEKHTKGIGSKLLEQMGFKPGQGLGKKASGIVEPIQAVPRQGRATLGAYSTDKIEPQLKDEAILDKSSEVPKPQPFIPSWQRTKKKEKHYLKKSFDQLRKETEESLTSVSYETVKIVDMTKPETKVTYGYDSINATQAEKLKTHSNFNIPELEHNIHILVSSTERSIKSLFKRIQIKKDLLNSHNQQKVSICRIINDTSSDIADFNHLVSLLEKFQFDLENEPEIFKRVELFIYTYPSIFSDKFYDFKLDGLIGSTFYPALFTLLKQWNAFVQPLLLFNLFEQWKICLSKIFFQNNDSLNGNLSEEIFDKTICDLWIPKFVDSLFAYDLENSSHILLFLNYWKPLLSEITWSETINVLSECLALHIENSQINDLQNFLWIAGYQDVIEDLDLFYKIVLKKFTQKLQKWHPSNPFAHKFFLSWSRILPKEKSKSFVNQYIVPILNNCLETEFKINPRNQILDPLMWILDWKEIIDISTLATIVYRGFSMNWLKILHVWLNQQPNFQDVKKWYSGWKTLLNDFTNEPSILHTFSQALDMIDKSVKGLPVPEPIEFIFSTFTAQPSGKIPKISLSFKDLLETTATDNCIIFTPTSRKRPDGKTIYQFGSNNIFVDRDVVFIENKNGSQRWNPISISDLVRISNV